MGDTNDTGLSRNDVARIRDRCNQLWSDASAKGNQNNATLHRRSIRELVQVVRRLCRDLMECWKANDSHVVKEAGLRKEVRILTEENEKLRKELAGLRRHDRIRDMVDKTKPGEYEG